VSSTVWTNDRYAILGRESDALDEPHLLCSRQRTARSSVLVCLIGLAELPHWRKMSMASKRLRITFPNEASEGRPRGFRKKRATAISFPHG